MSLNRYMLHITNQGKPQWEIASQLLGWLLLKQEIKSVGENAEKRKPYTLLVGMWIGTASIETIRSDQISRSVVSDYLWPHKSQHARPPCPSPTPGVHWDSGPSSQRCHSFISSSVVPFSSCPQSLPASESFPMSQHCAWGGQSTGVSALASFLPKKP